MQRLSVLFTLLTLSLLPATVRTARAEERNPMDGTMARMAEEHQHDKPAATAAATTPPAQWAKASRSTSTTTPATPSPIPRGGSYNPKAAEDSWKRTTAFFRTHLK